MSCAPEIKDWPITACSSVSWFSCLPCSLSLGVCGSGAPFLSFSSPNALPLSPPPHNKSLPNTSVECVVFLNTLLQCLACNLFKQWHTQRSAPLGPFWASSLLDPGVFPAVFCLFPQLPIIPSSNLLSVYYKDQSIQQAPTRSHLRPTLTLLKWLRDK